MPTLPSQPATNIPFLTTSELNVLTVLLYYLLVKGEVHVLSHSTQNYDSYSYHHELLSYQISTVSLTIYDKNPWASHHTESCPYMDLFGNQLHTAHSPGFDVLYVM